MPFVLYMKNDQWLLWIYNQIVRHEYDCSVIIVTKM